MTARGTYNQKGENVYLWKNDDNTFEYVPAVEGTGATSETYYNTGAERDIPGKSGTNGINRQTGGGGISINYRNGTHKANSASPNGGAGNPGGIGASNGNGNNQSYNGQTGTGGLLVIY